jgi:hypothetical protein
MSTAAADPNGLNPLPDESGMAMNAMGNAACMRCAAYEAARNIAESFMPFKTLVRQAKQGKAQKPQEHSQIVVIGTLEDKTPAVTPQEHVPRLVET